MVRGPDISLDIHQRLEQKLILTPQLVQSLEILQLPIMELSTAIKQEMEENPTIELKEESESGEEETPTPAVAEDDKGTMLKILDEGRGDFDKRRTTRRSEAIDAKIDAMQNTPDQTATLPDYLYQQFILMKVSERERTIGRHIIYNLNEQGLLRIPLEEIATLSQSNVEEVTSALETIQQLDPPGVGARDPKEQLLLQLDEADPNFKLKRKLITDHLEDIYQNRLPELASRFGLSLDELKIALEEIKSLRIRPARDFSPEKTFYVTPDVMIEDIDDKYEIKLNKTFLPKLSISAHYRNILNDPSASAELKKFVREKIERAQNIISAVYLRQNTLRRITQEIINVQQDFLKNGPGHLKPLTMSELAERLGIHLSTVSRTIARKYIQTPQGIFTMRFFFVRFTETVHGEKQLKEHVVKALKELIDAEDKQQPLSDEAIAQALKPKGFNIARRTVALYRESLNIPTAQQRKQY